MTKVDPAQTTLSGTAAETNTVVPFSSPELNAVPVQVATPVSSTVPWRLIPLDMSVKIPYPLMQLSIGDLSHRFEDPRLRGQLTALKPTPNALAKPLQELPSVEDLNTDPSANGKEEEKPTDLLLNPPIAPVSRRPPKLQLNEMANTFAHSHPPVAAARLGDRSYLDDPRFRRRRILAPSKAISTASSDGKRDDGANVLTPVSIGQIITTANAVEPSGSIQ